MIARIQNASLQTKILMLLITMSTFLSFTLGIVFYQNTAENTLKNKEREMITLSTLTANKIELFLFERSADIKVLAASQIFVMEEVSTQTQLSYLQNVIRAYKTYDTVFIMNLEGTVTLLSGIRPSENELNLIRKNGLTDKAYISDIQVYDDEWFLYFIEPLWNEKNELVGSIVEKMNFDSISDIIDDIKLGETGYASIRKLDHPESLEEEVGISHNQTGKLRYMSATYPIKKYASQKDQWVVDLIQNEDEALIVKKDIERYFIYVVIGFLLFFYVLSIIISRNITQPIRSLMVKTNAIMENNQKFASDVIVSDEVKTLTTSFDLLLDELQFMMQQVLEKTGEAAHIEHVRNSIDTLFDHIPNGIITTDQAGIITFVNDYAHEILESKNSELLGTSIRHRNIPYLSPLFSLIAAAFDKGENIQEEVCHIHLPKGKSIPLVFSTLSQLDSHDHLIGITIIINHLDAKQNFEESILRAKKLSELGELAAGVAHEIRNPLASIRGYAQVALREVKVDDQVASDIAIILMEVDRLDKIIERFMTFARPNNPSFGIYHMNDIIEDTIRLIDKDHQTKGINIRYRYTKNDLIRVDYEQMKQVLINLILNAVQAMPHGGKLELVTILSEKSGTMEIHIVDEGEGIEEDLLENIFKPFFTTREKGSGLGLSICSRIIENHNGIMEIKSRPKVGTQIIIKLPLEGRP